jgi:hypothetical protein
MVSLDSPFVQENGRPQIDRLGTSNLAPLVTNGQINPQLAANNIRVIRDTHGKTSQLSADDLDALEAYLKSLSMSGANNSSSGSGSSTSGTSGSGGSGSGGTGSGGDTTAGVSKAQFTTTDVRVDEGAGSATVEVARTGDLTRGADVDYMTTDVSASDRSDYTVARGTLRFAPGETRKTVTVLITDDAAAEQDEQINVSLTNPGAGCTLGEAASATITIADNDAATAAQNPADDASFFVREHYHDFLNREPDSSGLQFWTNEIASCGADAQCRDVKRVNVSAAFFLSIEFQRTGYLVYKLYLASFGRVPTLAEFLADMKTIGQDVVVGQPGWEQKLAANRAAFLADWVNHPAFASLYDSLTNAQYVDALYANAGLQLSAAQREALVNGLNAGTLTRSRVLLDLVENEQFSQREFNRAFVVMQYFGYLRRDPDAAGLQFWLSKLNQFKGNYIDAEMVKAFISSIEYRRRFGK